jgi:hypothetical protein
VLCIAVAQTEHRITSRKADRNGNIGTAGANLAESLRKQTVESIQ